MPAIYSLSSGALPPSAVVVGFRGVEAISQPYRFEIGFQVAPGDDFDLEAALGQRATLTADRGAQSPPVRWNGIIAELALVREHASYALFSVTLAPKLWQLTLTQHSRIFTDNTIPEIISAVLTDSGVTDFTLNLAASYKRHEHVCQYKESNLAFISRLMEREGMYYYFEQGDGIEQLVIVDNRSFHQPLATKPFRYFPLAGQDVSAGEAIEDFRCKLSAVPAKVRLTEYDYNHPSLKLAGNARVHPHGTGDIVVYGENFTTPDEGERYATIRAEELGVRRSLFHGHGQAFYLRPGYTFTLEEHPREAFNDDYLTIELEHHGNQSAAEEARDLLGLEHAEVYRVYLKAIPAKAQFRARRETPRPHIHGVVDATVDGPAGSPYAQIDAQGRYKVRIFFDESDLIDGSASTWVRMLQPHGGSVEGFHFPLRKTTEVHILFLGGDPDRPVIAGVAHNTQKPSLVTSSNNTFNVIQTGSLNRIEIDDLIGSEYIRIFCPKLQSYLRLGHGSYNFIAHTEGTGWIYIGSDFDVDVKGNMTEDVTGTVDINYMSTMDITVKGAVVELFKTSLDTTVTGPVTILYTGKLDEKVRGKVTKTYETGYDHTVNGGLTNFTYNVGHDLTVNGGLTKERFNASHDVKVTGTLQHEVTGNVTETFGPTNQTVKGSYDITATGTVTVNAPKIVFNAPDFISTDTDASETRSKQMNILGLEFDYKSTNLAIMLLRIEALILDIKLVGVNVQLSGLDVNFAGFRLDEEGFRATFRGAKADMSGPDIMLTAIVVII